MALLFDLDAPGDAPGRAHQGDAAGDDVSLPDAQQIAADFAKIRHGLLDLPVQVAVSQIAVFRAGLDATEGVILGGVIGSDGDTRRAENLAGSTGKTSKRAARRAAKRAKVAKKNPAIGDKMASGDLSAEHVDVIADTADKTDGAAAVDADFIDAVGATDPDQAKAAADRFVTDHTTAGQAETRRQKQRRKRTVSRFVTAEGLDAVMIAGDRESIDEIHKTLTATAAGFYRDDGGRDVAGSKHPRTANQRMFDAAHAHLTGKIATDAEPGSARTDSAGAQTVRSRRFTPPKTRVAMFVTATVEKLAGLAPNEAAQQIGVGPIADSLLAEYLTDDPELVGLVFGQDGHPLWLGRSTRFASQAQLRALMVRDKGCVLCRRSHQDCEAHHTMPWNAPAKGETNLDELVLLCPSCHHKLHDTNHSLYQQRITGHWKTRPATAAETPPKRPTNTQTTNSDRPTNPGHDTGPNRV